MFPNRFTTLTLLSLLCLLLASCVTSMYPLSEGGKDVVFRPELLGTWKEAEGNTIAVLERGEDTTYAITMVETRAPDGTNTRDTSYFTGQLVQAGGYLLLDCTVNLDEQSDYERLGNYTKSGLVPVHFLFHVDLKKGGNELELGQLQKEVFDKLLLHKYATTRHLSVGDERDERLVLLEPSGNLKKLLVQLLKEDKEVWEKSTWVREAGQ